MKKHDIWELVRRSTVRLESAANGHIGTGFFAGRGFVITAAHVVVDAKDDPAVVVVVWEGNRYVPTAVRLLAEPPVGEGSDRPYPWPDVAILKVDVPGDHPCVPLSDDWPSQKPGLSLYAWAYADEYRRYVVGGTSVRLAYNGPTEDTASPPGAGGALPRLLKMKFEQVIPGMSGAPVLDEESWTVCAVMKRTRNDSAQEGGYATAIDDVWGFAAAEPLVAELRAAQHEYRRRTGREDLEAAARWGGLPAVVAECLDATTAEVINRALAPYGQDVDLTSLQPDARALVIARHLFRTDIETLALVLSDLVDRKALRLEVAQKTFECVSCCLPVSAEWEGLSADRPVAWWIPPEAAEQLRREVRFDRPVVARVPASRRQTIKMLVNRASAQQPLRLARSDTREPLTPDAADWLDAVDAVIRDEVPGAGHGWWKDATRRRLVLQWLRRKQTLIPLPETGPLTASDLDDLFSRFGDLACVLARRQQIDPVDRSPHVITIQPEVDPVLEEEAVFHYENILGRAS